MNGANNNNQKGQCIQANFFIHVHNIVGRGLAAGAPVAGGGDGCAACDSRA